MASALIVGIALLGVLAALASSSPMVNQGVVSAEDAAAGAMKLLQINVVPDADVTVEPLMAIEDVWNIEDTHTLTEEALVTRMCRNGAELGLDASSATFYCTLGMDSESWPELRLTAAGAEGMHIAFVDDYAWDDVREAVSRGTQYQLIAWTATEYTYVRIIFTGLPIVTLHAENMDLLDEEYMPGRVTISSAKYPSIDYAAEMHLRSGGDNRAHDKLSYRFGFKRITSKGRTKDAKLPVLGMEEGAEWLLIGSPKDETCVLNHLGWQLWQKWNSDGNAFALLQSRMVELFANDEYQGLYELLEPIDPKAELKRVGAANRGAAARVITTHNTGKRPYSDQLRLIEGLIELRYRPESMTDGKALAMFDDYARLSAREKMGLSDGEFAELAALRIDAAQLFDYWLFFQSLGLGGNNVWNNAWIWALPEGGEVKYNFSPWDMDISFLGQTETGIDRSWTLPVRLLTMDILDSRRICHALWEEKKGIVSQEALMEWLEETENEINDSGAYLRDSAKWRGEARRLDLTGLLDRATERIAALEECLAEEWPAEGK